VASPSVAAAPVWISCLLVAGSMPPEVRTWYRAPLADASEIRCRALPSGHGRNGYHAEWDINWVIRSYGQRFRWLEVVCREGIEPPTR